MLSTLRDYGIYFALLGIIAAFAAISPDFRTGSNALLILLQISVNGIVAIGMLFTILTAGIDLSVGKVLAIAGICSALLAQQGGAHEGLLIALLVPLLVGTAAGAVNGAVITVGRVNPLIVTLGTFTAYKGFVVWFHVDPVYNLAPAYRLLGTASVLGIPAPVIIFLAVAGLAAMVLNLTTFGRYVYAVGGNEEAARAAGINVELIKLAVYMISGLGAGLAALVSTARQGSAQATAGEDLALQAIAAVVVGGASLFGGRGTVSKTLVGALIIGVLFNGLVMLNVSSPVQQMIIGSIIIGAVWVDGVLKKAQG
jgi:ribose/xylose/arabinose/galactoside ABC-type transport system permease subunit